MTIHVYFGFISCFKTSSSKRSLVLQPERMALLKSGIKRACQQLSFSMPSGISVCRQGHTGSNILETRHDWLLTIIARPPFPSRHLSTQGTRPRYRPSAGGPTIGKRKTKNLQRLPTSHQKSEEDCSSRSLAGMRGMLAASGSEVHQTKLL